MGKLICGGIITALLISNEIVTLLIIAAFLGYGVYELFIKAGEGGAI